MGPGGPTDTEPSADPRSAGAAATQAVGPVDENTLAATSTPVLEVRLPQGPPGDRRRRNSVATAQSQHQPGGHIRLGLADPIQDEASVEAGVQIGRQSAVIGADSDANPVWIVLRGGPVALRGVAQSSMSIRAISQVAPSKGSPSHH